MPVFSAFTPFGLLAFSGRKSLAQEAYKAIRNGMGDAYAEGGYHAARHYAAALSVGRATAAFRRSVNGLSPRKATDLLPGLERDYDIVPPANASIPERQDAVAVRMRLTGGARLQNIEAALSDALGSDFVALHVQTAATATAWPTDPAASVVGLYAAESTTRKVARLVDAVTVIGSQTVRIEDATADDSTMLKGDVVSVQNENEGLAERATISAVGTSGGYQTITATWTKAHDVGATVSTAPWPMWTSNMRQCMVELSATAAVDPEKRRVAHDIMGRMARVVSTWGITNNPAGPFVLDQDLLDNGVIV